MATDIVSPPSPIAGRRARSSLIQSIPVTVVVCYGVENSKRGREEEEAFCEA